MAKDKNEKKKIKRRSSSSSLRAEALPVALIGYLAPRASRWYGDIVGPCTSTESTLCRLRLVSNNMNPLKMGPTRLLALKITGEGWIHKAATIMIKYVFNQVKIRCLIYIKHDLKYDPRTNKITLVPSWYDQSWDIWLKIWASGSPPGRFHHPLLASSSAEIRGSGIYLLNVIHETGRLVPSIPPQLWATRKSKTKGQQLTLGLVIDGTNGKSGRSTLKNKYSSSGVFSGDGLGGGFTVGRGRSRKKMKLLCPHIHAIPLQVEDICHSLSELRRGSGYKCKLSSHIEMGPNPITAGHLLAMWQDKVTSLSLSFLL